MLKYTSVQQFLDDGVLVDKLKVIASLHTNKIQLIELDGYREDGFRVFSIDKECVFIIPSKEYNYDYYFQWRKKGYVFNHKVKKINDLLYVDAETNIKYFNRIKTEE